MGVGQGQSGETREALQTQAEVGSSGVETVGSSHLEAEPADQGPALGGCGCRPSSRCWSGMSMELDLERIRNFHPGDLGEEWGRKEAGMTPGCECL